MNFCQVEVPPWQIIQQPLTLPEQYLYGNSDETGGMYCNMQYIAPVLSSTDIHTVNNNQPSQPLIGHPSILAGTCILQPDNFFNPVYSL